MIPGGTRLLGALAGLALALAAPPGCAEDDAPPKVSYGPDGLLLQSEDGNYQASIRWRLQLRGVVGNDDDPIAPADFEDTDRVSVLVRRARFKLKGHAIGPWVQYNLEYDFVATRLLNFEVTLERYPWLKLRLGQWKAEFNRERRDSSSDQQFAERSIVNDPFTVDRQQGVMLTGRVLPGKLLDSSYYAGLFTGMGRGGGENDDSNPMWMLRYQWNVFGRELPFAQSDVLGRKQPAASLSVATMNNRSPFTAYSSSGGEQLPGYADGAPGQYSLRQWVEEAALHYRGVSLQHEFHWKRVTDHAAGRVQDLRGSYAQAGIFVYRPEAGKPRGLELAVRWAFVDPDTAVADDRRQELTGAVNWFLRGHSNKLTLEVSRLSLEQAAAPELVSHRARLQWDVHF